MLQLLDYGNRSGSALMGADGGLSFCKVRDRDTAQRLLSPFGVQFDNFDGASDVTQSAHYTYLEENEQEVAGYVCLEYGSFCYLPCWSDIAEMLDTVPDLLENLGEGATLADVLDDVATSPWWEEYRRGRSRQAWNITYFHKFLWDSWKDGWEKSRSRGYGPRHDEGIEILEMPLKKWAEDLNRAISVKTIWSVETWT